MPKIGRAFIISLILLGVMAIVIFVFLSQLKSSGPSVSVIMHSQEAKRFQIELVGRDINGIIGFAFWSGKPNNVHYVWALKSHGTKTIIITYGVVPSGFTQVFPEDDGVPEPLVPGDKYYLRVDIQYDEFLAASTDSRYFEFEVDDKGFVQFNGERLTVEKPKE